MVHGELLRNHLRPRRGITSILWLLLLIASRDTEAAEPWGTDTNAGTGPKLIEETVPELLRILNADPDERPGLIEAYASGKAADQIEAVKRFRNPELHGLFVKLAEHKEWKVRHRALFVLEYYGRSADLTLAFGALSHDEPRLREKAAITAIKLWDPAAAKGMKGDPAKTVSGLLDRETDPHVAAALRALAQRMAGKLLVRKVYTEHVERRPDGLLVSPFLSGMHTVKQVAPGYTKKGISESGGSSATKLPAGPWTSPIILFGKEARSGLSLQPFANLRQGGTVYHTGLDAGACLDGAGYYAIAPGIVRFVYTGTDMGTLVVLQHHLGNKRTVNAVHMHGGDTVFVKGGDKVKSGQLIATMGLGYSIENGGHYAHIHFGLYPGKFSATHNFGYRSIKAGLMDWYDPMHYIPLWTDVSRPLISANRSLAGLGKAADLLLKDQPGKAYKAAGSQGPAGESLQKDLEDAVSGAVERAEKIRDLGYPSRALAFLERYAKSAKGIPGDKAIADAAKAFKRDKTLKGAIKAEAKIHVTEDRTIAMVGKPAEAKAVWEALLKSLEGTCLVPRIRQMIAGVGLKTP